MTSVSVKIPEADRKDATECMEELGQQEQSLKFLNSSVMDATDKDTQPVPDVKNKYRLELEAPLVSSDEDGVNTKAARTDANRTVQDILSYHWIRITQSLLKLRFNVNKVDFDGLSPLHIAVSYGNRSHVKSVIRAGADVNRVGYRGCTALMQVILSESKDKIDKVNLLLEEGADLNRVNNKGETALMLAVSRRRTNIVNTQLDAGVDINKSNHRGNTALMLTTFYSFLNPLDSNMDFDIMKALLKAGADVNKVDDNGRDSFNHSCLQRADMYGKCTT